ncbi:MAG TPA: tRNA (adenosine(37)-N6)-threonylcarbamoyltransferase complex dimerization subunit type 1 TsaB [Alphaproteobacteria bacterium]|nr:tRNA (adenosine(37)-N6)-threonylcarbamoyltransferase complex dimerization subunit type 1 TsaB [Alphaproteobacteria bacterium]
MNILALDSSFGGLSLALRAGGKTHARSVAEAKASDKLLPLLQELLTEANIKATGINQVVATIGPGSFTGIRLGLAVAEGLKLANPKLTIIGVPTFSVLAAQVVKTHQPKTAFTLLLDAAGGQVYRQDFAATGKPLADAVCEPLATLKKLQPFIATQTGLLPPFATHASFTLLDADVLLAAATDTANHVPATPVYLKELGYRRAG